MLLEADYHRHRNNHQLLLATREQLDKWHLNNTTKIVIIILLLTITINNIFVIILRITSKVSGLV